MKKRFPGDKLSYFEHNLEAGFYPSHHRIIFVLLRRTFFRLGLTYALLPTRANHTYESRWSIDAMDYGYSPQ